MPVWLKVGAIGLVAYAAYKAAMAPRARRAPGAGPGPIQPAKVLDDARITGTVSTSNAPSAQVGAQATPAAPPLPSSPIHGSEPATMHIISVASNLNAGAGTGRVTKQDFLTTRRTSLYQAFTKGN